MTDQELIEHLRAGPEIIYRYVSVDHAAANRIEELVKDLSDGSFYKETTIDALIDQRDEAEAKLTKAVAALREIERYSNYNNSLVARKARTTLAELEGK